MLCLMPPRSLPLKFAILVAGFLPNDPKYMGMCEGSGIPKLAMPSLHIIGTTDDRIPVPTSKRLASCFDNPTILEWEGGHAVPSTAEFRKTLKAFIEEHSQGVGRWRWWCNCEQEQWLISSSSCQEGGDESRGKCRRRVRGAIRGVAFVEGAA